MLPAFVLILILLSARGQAADVPADETARVQQRLERQAGIHNLRRDIEAFKRSKNREMRALLDENAQEILFLRANSVMYRASLRRAMDLNHNGHLDRTELLMGRDMIRAAQKQDRSRWISLREKHRRMVLALKEEKKREYREIRRRFNESVSAVAAAS